MSDPGIVVSIIIVSYNTRDDTLRCLQSIVDHGVDATETVVVDNGSADGSVEAVRVRFPDVVLIEAGENLGFARGVNRAAEVATGNYLLLLNPDAILMPGSLAALLDFAREHPQYRMYGGRNITPSGENDPSSCWGAPSMWSMICFASGLSTLFSRSPVFDPDSLGRWPRDTVREVPVITGSLMLISREDWNFVGGMDERFFLYGDDAEFSIRARRRGLRPVIVPEATIIHDKGGSTSGAGTKMCMVMAGKATLLIVEWNPVLAKLGIAMLQAGSGLRALLEVIGRRTKRTWSTVWTRRKDWRHGYPEALEPLFGVSARWQQPN